MHNSPYTLITGASEGFGKALALECASRAMNLVLVALPGEELKRLACFIERNYSVSVLCFGHDLTKKEECYLLYKTIKEKNIAINMLINNAGLGGTHLFKEKDVDFYQRQIALNVTTPTILTHFFLERLQQHPVSYILNVCSLASFFSLPQKQVYGGTKSYLLSFSKSLAKELKQKNVCVSAICPGGMNTSLPLTLDNRGLSGIRRWSVMNPEDVAKIAIDGVLQRKELIIPGSWNRLFVLLDRILPAIIKDALTSRAIKQANAFKKGSGELVLNPHHTGPLSSGNLKQAV